MYTFVKGQGWVEETTENSGVLCQMLDGKVMIYKRRPEIGEFDISASWGTDEKMKNHLKSFRVSDFRYPLIDNTYGEGRWTVVKVGTP